MYCKNFCGLSTIWLMCIEFIGSLFNCFPSRKFDIFENINSNFQIEFSDFNKVRECFSRFFIFASSFLDFSGSFLWQFQVCTKIFFQLLLRSLPPQGSQTLSEIARGMEIILKTSSYLPVHTKIPTICKKCGEIILRTANPRLLLQNGYGSKKKNKIK